MARGGTATLERNIVRNILKHLNKLDGAVFRKRHGGEYGVSGDPDITGCYRGRHVEIEAKQEGKYPTPAQRHRLKEWEESGAFVGVARNVSDALEIVGRVDESIRAGESYKGVEVS